MYSGIGGWAGIGVAAGIGAEDPTAGLGALGAFGDAGQFSNQGGVMTVFGLKNMAIAASNTRHPAGRRDVPSGGGGGRLRNEHGAGVLSAPASFVPPPASALAMTRLRASLAARRTIRSWPRSPLAQAAAQDLQREPC